MALLSMRARKITQSNWKEKSSLIGRQYAGNDKSRFRCFSTAIKWDFLTRECRAPRSKDNQIGLKMVAGLDWSDMAEGRNSGNHGLLMAFSILKSQKKYQMGYYFGLNFEKAYLKQEKDGVEFKITNLIYLQKDLEQLLGREIEPKKVRENNDAPIIEDWVLDDEDDDEPNPKVEKKTVIPTATKKEFVKPKKPVRRSVSCPNQQRKRIGDPLTHGASLVNQQLYYIDARGRRSKSSRHMTGHIAHLSDFKDLDECYVTFGWREHMEEELLVKVYKEFLSLVHLLNKIRIDCYQDEMMYRKSHEIGSLHDNGTLLDQQVNTARLEPFTVIMEGPSHASERHTSGGQEIELGNIPIIIMPYSTPQQGIHKDHPFDNEEPKRVSKALSDPAWVEAMQEELL
ncbi:hypothetical protein Tco_1081844 [Tanacetum coccineum]|uniref:Uncharacterized protein n=1 Tax=Tanacetum coccineum TaxID=301880 RepID=A0ABQ5HZZ6_9ASTR